VSEGPRGGVSPDFRPGEDVAHALDRRDPLADCRGQFCFPADAQDRPVAYFCGNSLGLQPAGAGRAVEQELEDWSRLAVDAHFAGRTPWFSYHEALRDPSSRLVGAAPSEVVAMNGLTTNLHLMLVSFYRPTRGRHRILIEENAFPSDNYAVRSQIRFHGFDAEDSLLIARARPGETRIRTEDLAELIDREGEGIALILLGGVQYYSGQLFDMPRITEAGRRQGCTVGFDLAHAVGNVPLSLHDWNVDFAVWCSYKYLNAGPGAVAGCFVHERHHRSDLPRFAGWWGNDPGTRFRMHLEAEFAAVPSADAWQLSNPPILAAAPLRVSLEIFDRVGMDALREKSLRLTEYLLDWIVRRPTGHCAYAFEPVGAGLPDLDCARTGLAGAVRAVARGRSRLRLPRAGCDPRRPRPALQFVPRRLALRPGAR